jgi:alpha-tubulin suppressor-like RCC1 family protein
MSDLITTANSNYRITNTDIAERGFVAKEYIIDAFPNLPSSLVSSGLWGWGSGSDGVLGNENNSQRNSPVQTIAGGTNWKRVHGNSSDSVCGIKKDGTLWLWGNNRSGKLGTNDTSPKSSPVQTVLGGTNWRQGATNYGNSGGIKDDGTLWIWGANDQGQLGINDTINRSSPVQTIAGGTTWRQIAIGYRHVSAVKSDGTLWSWGSNNRGQLGDDTNSNRSSPVQTIALGSNWRQVSTGLEHTAAIKDDGTLWLWGRNHAGQLGDGTTTHRSSPVQTIAGGNNWKLVACGDYHTAAVKHDGTLWLWGNGGNGRLGNNSTQNRSSPVQTAAGGDNWHLVACGIYHTAAIKKDGSMWTWGSNSSGQLGINVGSGSRSSPVQVVHGFDWVSVCATADNTYGVKDDGTIASERSEYRINDVDTNNIWVRKSYV